MQTNYNPDVLSCLANLSNDASLEHIGINKQEGEDIGLYETVLSRKDYEESLENEAV
jgi:hypothetical protein